MRPVPHPPPQNFTVEGILHALSDPVRVAIYAELAGQSCSTNCTGLQQVLRHPIPKSTLSQHMRVLREAGLIRSERRGVEVLNSSRCPEVEARFPGLLGSIVKSYELQAQDQGGKKKRRS